ncbi:MAG TPA: amidohydrolase [Candidatus Acidoferrales bacterium]|nr:amidohydrolase [Candidatus Acidoferrales bacterium]
MAKSRRVVGAILLIGLAGLAGFWLGRGALRPTALYPDAVYYNGKVLTVDKNFSVAQAFAIWDGKFVAVGASRAALALAGPRTEKVDLRGRTVIPGLSDDHYHFMMNAGADFKEISLVRARSFDEFLGLIKKRADETPPGQVIETQSGWLPDQFGGRLPDKDDLDKVAPRNPLFVRGGHTMYLNTAALNLARITRATPNPPGGVISRDAKTGELTGELVDNAMSLVDKFLPKITVDDKINGLLRGQKLLNSVGLTSVRDPGVGPADIRIYQQLWDDHKMTVRVSTNLSLPTAPPAKEILAELDNWGVHTPFGDHTLRLDGIGEFGIDGGFQAGLMRQPYEQSPDVGPHRGAYFGLQKIPTDKFTEVIRGLNRLGWRACIHTVGDKALDVVLDAYEKANQDQSIVGKRWTIEHALVSEPDQFERIKKLGVVISSQFHTYMASRTMIQDWGQQRGAESVRTRDWLAAGLKVGVGTDWTLMPPNPFEVLSFLVTRKNRYGELVGPDQRISRQDALRLATMGNAYITFEENTKGSIEVGKLADFAVLDRDYLAIPEDDIKNIKVLRTVVGGKVVFQNGD